jgi:uncharacterized membrane protein
MAGPSVRSGDPFMIGRPRPGRPHPARVKTTRAVLATVSGMGSAAPETGHTVRARPPVPRAQFAWARAREVTVDSFWIVPSLFLAGAVVLTYAMGRLDQVLTAPIWWVGTAEAAGDVLGTVAAAMLTFLGVVFSITLVALQLASQQFSPRVTRTFVRSTTTKVAFGVFIATFVAALLARTRIEERTSDLPGPTASVTLSLTLVGASLVVFIAFVNRITGLIRIAHLVAAVADETRGSLELVYPPASAYVQAAPPRFDPPTSAVVVHKVARRTHRRSRGVLLGVNIGRLLQLATAHDCVIRFTAHIGQNLSNGMPLAEIYGRDGPSSEQILHAVQFGRERTLYEDPAYGIRELVDIGCQALSPAVNAPTTAVQVIDRLTDLLARIGNRPDPTGLFVDEHTVVRLVIPTTTWQEMVNLAFTELRTFGVGSPQVTRRLAAALNELTTLVPTHRAPDLKHQQTLLHAAVHAHYTNHNHRHQALQPDPLGLG